MVVYLFYTRHSSGEVVLLSVYKKSHYQDLYNRVAEIAERHGRQVMAGSGRVAIQTGDNETGQVWYAERWDCE
jgi:hypothetical protein